MHVVEELNSVSDQVASMTKRNTDHAHQAVGEVNLAMSDLTDSMNEI